MRGSGMRILVYAHAMEIGGSQLNAIELAGALSRLGHHVSLVGEPGPLAARVDELGLDHIEIPLERSRPSPHVLRQLHQAVHGQGVDVVHAFEWPPAIEAFLTTFARRRPVAVATVMSMGVPWFLPRDLPVTFGTRALVDDARALGFRQVRLLEPPVDTEANWPGFAVTDFRARVPALPGVSDVLMVCRLVNELKLAGLLEAVDAVAGLPAERNARLVIVGDGPARAIVASRVEAANARCGRQVAVLAGEMSDPRSAYAAATVVLGMGGSALRALAFARPLVVQGEAGYWCTLTPDSLGDFLARGWFGVGDGSDGSVRLRGQLEELLGSPELRTRLGDFGRATVVDQFSLAGAASDLVAWYEELLAQPRSVWRRTVDAAAALPPLLRLGAYKVRRRRAKRRGGVATDDFNVVARPEPDGRSGEVQRQP
jgi:glycosyltransferase involved in cell wall biosynthesis